MVSRGFEPRDTGCKSIKWVVFANSIPQCSRPYPRSTAAAYPPYDFHSTRLLLHGRGIFSLILVHTYIHMRWCVEARSLKCNLFCVSMKIKISRNDPEKSFFSHNRSPQRSSQPAVMTATKMMLMKLVRMMG